MSWMAPEILETTAQYPYTLNESTISTLDLFYYDVAIA